MTRLARLALALLPLALAALARPAAWLAGIGDAVTEEGIG